MQRFRKRPVAKGTRSPKKNKQFEKLQATELYCPNCRQAMPVVERLLLVLPEGDKYEYLCARCGTSVGERTEKGDPKGILIV
jgi:DNA-directed RNA polymerase subunit RPC12/RpoP